jgi:hypothetical protein
MLEFGPPWVACGMCTVQTAFFAVRTETCHDEALSMLFDSSSFPMRPKLRIDPAFGAFSLGCAASAFRYAFCIDLARAVYRKETGQLWCQLEVV